MYFQPSKCIVNDRTAIFLVRPNRTETEQKWPNTEPNRTTTEQLLLKMLCFIKYFFFGNFILIEVDFQSKQYFETILIFVPKIECIFFIFSALDTLDMCIFAPNFFVRFGSVIWSLFGRSAEITEQPIFGRTEKPNRISVVHYSSQRRGIGS